MGTASFERDGFTSRYEEQPDWHIYEDAKRFAPSFNPGDFSESEIHEFLDHMYEAVGPEWFDSFIASEYSKGDRRNPAMRLSGLRRKKGGRKSVLQRYRSQG